MSDLWEFSPSSLPLLEQCIKAANNRRSDSRWFNLLNTQKLQNDVNGVVPNGLEVPEHMDIDSDAIDNLPNTSILMDSNMADDKRAIDEFKQICDHIEQDTLKYIELYAEKLASDEKLLPMLAQNLSMLTIEMVLGNILDHININDDLLYKFFTNFIPVYFKRESATIFLDLLMKAHNLRPELCKALLEVLLCDEEAESLRVYTLVQDFLNALENTEASEYTDLLQIEVTRDAFVHHMQTIFHIYKMSTKTTQEQEVILARLADASQLCADDKTFGKFLLNYLQAQRTLGATKHKAKLEMIVESHKSNFRKPCKTILNKL